MRNIKARTLWIIVIIEFLASIGLIFACIYTEGDLNKAMIVIMTIDFILMAFTIQLASMKSFKYKPKKRKLEAKEYTNDNDLFDKLNELKFNVRERAYGKSYLKIEKRSAYKVVLITDPVGYFHHDEKEDDDQDEGLNKKLDNCLTFTAVEIFINSNDEVKEKISDFSIQVDKIYYTALEKIEDKYVCHNYEKPNEKHNDDVNYLFDMLGFKEIVEEKEETN